MPCSQCGGSGHNIKTCFRVHNEFMCMIDTEVLSTDHVPELMRPVYIEPIRPQPRPQPSPPSITSVPRSLTGEVNRLVNSSRRLQDSVYPLMDQVKLLRVQQKKWKNAAVRFNYLMNEMRKIGAADEERFPMFAMIMDLQQDIDLPAISEEDKHHANVPSVYTGLA